MYERIKGRWVTALRTGEVNGKPIEQTKGYLRRPDVNGVMQLCCLGVLCEIAAADGVVGIQESQKGDSFYYDEAGNNVTLPTLVMKWAGLKDDIPLVPFDNSTGNESLAALNDFKGYSFNQIADLIENHL